MSVTGHDLQRVIRQADAATRARPAAPAVPRRTPEPPSAGLSVEDVRAELRALLASLEELDGERRCTRYPGAFAVRIVPRIRGLEKEIRYLLSDAEPNDAAERVRAARAGRARLAEQMRAREEAKEAAERREQARALLGALPPEELAALAKGATNGDSR